MKFLLSVLAAGALLSAFEANGLEAVPSYTVGSANGGYVPGGAGFGFSPQTNLAVTALGFNGTGLGTTPYRVSLWQDGQQLASVMVTANSTLLNQTRYELIPAVQLVRGQTYYLSAAGTNNNYWIGLIIQTNIPPQAFSVAAEIQYLGTAFGTNSDGTFPNGTGDSSSYYVAPNFQYVVGGGTNLLWASTADNQWDIGVSFNWKNLANNQPDRFFNGEGVLFDDTRGVVTNVSIASGAAVVPLVLTNNSSTNNFTLNGPGRISGASVIVKDGGSTLTLNSSNDFTGSLTVYGGTLKVGSAAALGSTNGATLVTNSATLDLNGFSIGDEPVIVSGAGVGGGGALVNNSSFRPAALQHLTLSGDTRVGDNGYGWGLGAQGPASLLSGGRPLSLTKVGAGFVYFSNVTQIDPAFADIEIQQGTFGLGPGLAQLGDPARTIYVRSNALLSLFSVSGPSLNKRISLSDGTISCELGSNVISGRSTLTGTNSIYSVSGTPPLPGLVFSNTVSGTGSLVKLSPGLLSFAASNSFSGKLIVNGGEVDLLGSGSVRACAAIVLGPGTVFNITGRTDGILSLAPGQLLTGQGTVVGGLVAEPGSTVAPGGSPGLLAVSNSVVLQGNLAMELNKSVRTNDVLLSGGSILYGGTLMLTNLAGTLAAGDTFKLFTATNYAGAFTNIQPPTAGPGLSWDTGLLLTNGTLTVVSLPVITNATLTGTDFVISGTNGIPTSNYYVLSSTNLSVPLTNWARLTTNVFDANGNFVFTNAFDLSVPERFYLLQLP